MLASLLRSARPLGLIALAASACAPVSSFRAPLPLPPGATNQLSVGVGADAAAGIAALPGCAVTTNTSGSCVEGISAQLWAAYRFDHLELSGVLFGGTSVYAGGGAGIRYFYIDTPQLQLGVDGQLGWLWADVGLPLGVRLIDSVWLYTRPSFSVSDAPHAQLPLGFAIRLGDSLVLTPEIGVIAGDRPGGLAQLSVYGGIGLALLYPRGPGVATGSAATPETTTPPPQPPASPPLPTPPPPPTNQPLPLPPPPPLIPEPAPLSS